MPPHRLVAWCMALAIASTSGSKAQSIDGLPEADGERLVQTYLSMWSTDAGISPGAIATFYAPRVVYYGKAFSRSQVLDDKLAYIRQWPERAYREVPGSLTGSCNADKSLCTVRFEMSWRRVDRVHRVLVGRARMSFDFVSVEGRGKITRESARLL